MSHRMKSRRVLPPARPLSVSTTMPASSGCWSRVWASSWTAISRVGRNDDVFLLGGQWAGRSVADLVAQHISGGPSPYGDHGARELPVGVPLDGGGVRPIRAPHAVQLVPVVVAARVHIGMLLLTGATVLVPDNHWWI